MRDLSKNSPCPCGSGKTYRKCCARQLRLDSAVAKRVRKALELQEAADREYRERYGRARLPQGVRVGGRTYTMLEGRIYIQKEDGPYNFINAIHDHALQFFGDAYLEQEERKPFTERNVAIQWMHSYIDHQEKRKSAPRDVAEVPIGVAAAWFRFAYDLFTIRDNATLERRLKERLIGNQTFQAARHELSVAALTITAGFDIQFEDETDMSRRHPEFVAIDRYTGVKFAVEAKSRHRRGVKGFESGPLIKSGERAGVRQLVLDGYSKCGRLPLYLFIDVNLPPAESGATREGWLEEIDKTMADLASEGYANPCPANGIFFTNDPSHYVNLGEIGYDSDCLWMKHYEPKIPQIPHPAGDVFQRLLKAYHQRVAPPEEFPRSVG